jgi:N-acetylmuramoyl-L-alanine amidase
VVAVKRVEYESALPDIAWFQRRLAAIGYVVRQDGQASQETRNVLIAFHTRYRPSKSDGEADAETAALLDGPMQVAVRLPCAAVTEGPRGRVNGRYRPRADATTLRSSSL